MRCSGAALLEKCACAVAASSTLVDDEFDLIATGKRECHRVYHHRLGKVDGEDNSSRLSTAFPSGPLP